MGARHDGDGVWLLCNLVGGLPKLSAAFSGDAHLQYESKSFYAGVQVES